MGASFLVSEFARRNMSPEAPATSPTRVRCVHELIDSITQVAQAIEQVPQQSQAASADEARTLDGCARDPSPWVRVSQDVRHLHGRAGQRLLEVPPREWAAWLAEIALRCH